MLYIQKFIDHVGDLLQAYVDRREQVYFFILQSASRIWCINVVLNILQEENM